MAERCRRWIRRSLSIPATLGSLVGALHCCGPGSGPVHPGAGMAESTAAAEKAIALALRGARLSTHKPPPARLVHSTAAGWSATLDPLKGRSVEVAECAFIGPTISVLWAKYWC